MIKDREREIFNTIETVNISFNDFMEERLIRLGLDGLGSSHCFVLETLFLNNGRLSMSEIAENINRTKSTVTHLISKLETYHLVQREKSALDKRFAYVQLTDQAKAFYDEFTDMRSRIHKIVTKALSPSEQEHLITMMDKIDFQLRQQII